MPRDFRFSPDSCATTKLQRERFNMHSALLFPEQGRRLFLRHRTGQGIRVIRRAPPMGMRLRLKSSYNISGFSSQMQVILTAMKHYGLILADNGSALYVTGVSDSRWGSDLDSLKTVPASAFEVVQMNPVYTNANYPTGSAPTIASFTASTTHVSSGGSVILSWDVNSADYVIVSPGPGAVRDTSATVNPTATTTYTLYATNQYGRTTATVTVNVP